MDEAVRVADVVGAWRQGREERAARPARTPLVINAARVAARVAARTLPTWRRARTATLQVTAFAFLDYAAWGWHVWAGCVAVGVSLLVLEALGSDGRGGRR